MSSGPAVTVLVPMRNEEQHIRRCLAHVVDQDLAGAIIDADMGSDMGSDTHGSITAADLEIIVVDGNSIDGSAQAAKDFLAENHDGPWSVLDNASGTTPANLNLGLVAARAPLLCRVDARSLIPRNYVRNCISVLEQNPQVKVTGGRQLAIAPSDSLIGAGIGRALNNRFTMGMSRYRRGAGSGPTDTVYLGAFRTEELRAAGGWNEDFATNQDFELNRRMSRLGTIWFDASIPVEYIPRDNIADLWRQYRRFGNWKVHYWRVTSDRPQVRQAVLIAAPPLAAAGWMATLAATRGLRRAALCTAPLIAAALVDEVGSEVAPRSPAIRVTASAASAAVALGWWSGVAEAMLRRNDGEARSLTAGGADVGR